MDTTKTEPRPGTPVYPGQRGYALAVFAAASRRLPDGAPGGMEAAFAAIDDEIRAAVLAEREACAKIAEQCSGGDAETPAREVIAANIRARK